MTGKLVSRNAISSRHSGLLSNLAVGMFGALRMSRLQLPQYPRGLKTSSGKAMVLT